jgi:hypothetical protein
MLLVSVARTPVAKDLPRLSLPAKSTCKPIEAHKEDEKQCQGKEDRYNETKKKKKITMIQKMMTMMKGDACWIKIVCECVSR